MDASVSSYNQTTPTTPCRISPVGSSKRKSKPVKRIVEAAENHIVEVPPLPVDAFMGTAAAETTTELKKDTDEPLLTPREEEEIKPSVMDQQEALKRLAEIFGGNFTMQPVTTALFPATATAATFPAIFTTAGCTLDLSTLQTNGDANNTLASLLGGVSLPNFAITSTPNSLPTVIPTVSQTTDRLRTPSVSNCTSLANSKGPVKRKLFETGSRDMMKSMTGGGGYTKEERIDLDDLENFAQMFKKQRIKFGFTQGDVGVALGKRYGTDFSQTTISRFEALNLSFKNMCKLRPLLKEWLADAEAAIANGASLNDLLDRPNGEKTIKNDSPVPMSDPSIFGGEPMVKRRRKRTNLDIAQRTTLDAYFAMNPRPDHERMTEIANLLDLDRDVVRVWFCNRRQKMRRADEPDQPEDALLSSLRAIAQGDIAPADPTQPSSSL